MSELQTISQALFDEKAALAIKRTPMRKSISLKSIEVIDDEILSIEGRRISVTKEGMNSLCKIVGLPISFNKNFTKSFGEKARQNLVNRLKIAAQAKGTTSVSLAVNPHSRRIVDICKNPEEIISNDNFIQTSSRIIDRYGLEVLNFSVSEDGDCVINACSPKNMWGLQGMKNEKFYGGVSFMNSPGDGFEVSTFLNRLHCTNGMVGKAFEETFSLGSMDPKGMEKFYSELNDLASKGFKPKEFEWKVQAAAITPASLSEMKRAHDIITQNSDAMYGDIEPWIPYQTTREYFHRAGVDTQEIGGKAMKGARTGTSVWDLVNGLTNFGSWDHGFKLDEYAQRKIQMEASRLLSDDFDLGNQIQSPFKGLELTPKFGSHWN